jgi:hypothetical protein
MRSHLAILSGSGFFNRAVYRFAGAAIVNRDGIILDSALTSRIAIRIPARKRFRQNIAELLPHPVRRPSHRPLV